MKNVVIFSTVILELLLGINSHSSISYMNSSQNAVATVEGITINNVEAGSWLGYDVARTVGSTFVFKNNSITSRNSSGYMLQAGDESTNIYNNKLDGEIITGNKFIWMGNDKESITHALFTGYNLNVVIKYNYLLNTPMGVIRKSNGMTNASGGIAYNIINNPLKVAVAVKGMNNVNIFNNTFYSERTMSETWRPLVHIYSNDNPSAPSTGAKVFNNIFYTRYQTYNITIENNCLEEFECDFNIYWCESGSPLFLIGGKEKTFKQWQAMGYDKHSRVVNPDFINTKDLVPSLRLDYGKDLGDLWETGLSVDAVWSSKDPKTTDQNGKWQVGARIYKNKTGKTFYVATDGNDNNPGSIAKPFATWQKGFDSASPGDTVFIREGTYYPLGTVRENACSGVFISGKNGNSSNPIHIWAYPGETPVLDCRNMTHSTDRFGIYLFSADYWHLKGLSITRVDQVITGKAGANGIRIYSGNNNMLELIKSYANGGSGIAIVYASEENKILNCDTFDNYDPYTPEYKGGHADGIEIADIFERDGSERVNIIKGCRAWNNSDDGYDFYKCEGVLIIDSCWAWKNGYQNGDGSGFKLGTTAGSAEPGYQRILTNCLSYSNSMMGYDQNGADIKMKILNCTSYKNGVFGFNFWTHNTTDILRNNISYLDPNHNFQPNQISDHNNWQNNKKTGNKDFASFDDTQLYNERNPDGSLPDITFLHLSSRSDFVDAGVDVSLPFVGVAPDLGSFESPYIRYKPELKDYMLWLRILLLP